MTAVDTHAGPDVRRPRVDPGKLFIGGQWREGAQHYEVIDPSTGRAVTTVADATENDVRDAVLAARAAFDNGQWAHMAGRERGRVLNRVAELVRRRAGELVAVESLDVGKPVAL